MSEKDSTLQSQCLAELSLEHPPRPRKGQDCMQESPQRHPATEVTADCEERGAALTAVIPSPSVHTAFFIRDLRDISILDDALHTSLQGLGRHIQRLTVTPQAITRLMEGTYLFRRDGGFAFRCFQTLERALALEISCCRNDENGSQYYWALIMNEGSPSETKSKGDMCT